MPPRVKTRGCAPAGQAGPARQGGPADQGGPAGQAGQASGMSEARRLGRGGPGVCQARQVSRACRALQWSFSCAVRATIVRILAASLFMYTGAKPGCAFIL